MKTKSYYFAYGSNMNHIRMKRRCSDAEFIEKCILRRHKFVYDGYSASLEGAVANIVEDKDEIVEGGLFLISKEDEKNLDKYEGYPIAYTKKMVEVEGVSGKKYKAMVYYRNPLEIGEPSEFYRKEVLEGANNCGLSEEYIRRFL
ncbi:MAG: gamma-glutamylcyclotransferase [Chitinispirillaceae bacterium]|nr:gamma-glutamylcyclotransferase [Chitinispirillaceae bacterium]